MGWMDGKHSKKAERQPKPKAGTHVLAIDTMVTADLSKSGNGDCPKFTARVVESTSEAVGAEVGQIWFVHDGRDKWGYTLGEYLNFGRALVGSAAWLGKDPGDIDAVKGVLQQVFNPYREDKWKRYETEQPLRGIHIRCISKPSGEYVDLEYEMIPQTKEQLKAQREQLEAWKAGRVPTSEPATREEQPKAPASGLDDIF